jgi:hypothetical protein
VSMTQILAIEPSRQMSLRSHSLCLDSHLEAEIRYIKMLHEFAALHVYRPKQPFVIFTIVATL